MAYSVRTTRLAKSGLHNIGDWLHERSPAGSQSWLAVWYEPQLPSLKTARKDNEDRISGSHSSREFARKVPKMDCLLRFLTDSEIRNWSDLCPS